MDVQAIMEACLTWKHATYALAGLLMSSGGGVIWLDNEFDAVQEDLNKTKIELATVKEIKEDVKIIKECLIKKECG